MTVDLKTHGAFIIFSTLGLFRAMASEYKPVVKVSDASQLAAGGTACHAVKLSGQHQHVLSVWREINSLDLQKKVLTDKVKSAVIDYFLLHTILRPKRHWTLISVCVVFGALSSITVSVR